jgi:hypothetical protein
VGLEEFSRRGAEAQGCTSGNWSLGSGISPWVAFGVSKAEARDTPERHRMASISKNPPCVRALSLMAFVLAASVAVGAAAVE